jgi:hypothetical protein
MKHNHFLHVAKLVFSVKRKLVQWHIFCKLNSSERTNRFEICTTNSKTRGDRVAVPDDVQFVAEPFVCLDCSKSCWVGAPDPNISTKNRSCGRRKQRPFDSAQPIRMCTAIGIVEFGETAECC